MVLEEGASLEGETGMTGQKVPSSAAVPRSRWRGKWTGSKTEVEDAGNTARLAGEEPIGAESRKIERALITSSIRCW